MTMFLTRFAVTFYRSVIRFVIKIPLQLTFVDKIIV